MKSHASSPLPTRRCFLAKSALAVGALALGGRASAGDQPSTAPRYPLIGFSKPFQNFTAEQTADLVARVGWDGIECPVRAKGQIEPERAADELPRLTEALRRRKLDIYLLATDITSMKTPHAELVLRTAARLGIKRVRLGFFKYGGNEWPPDRLRELAPALREIAAACKDLGLRAGFENHSGRQ